MEFYFCFNSEEKSQNFATQMLPSGFFVIHDSSRGGHNNVTKLSGRQEVVGPLFNFSDTHVESGRNDTDFVQSASQVDDDFATTVVIHDLEFADVSMFHHHFQKSDDNFAAWSEQNLTFATFFSIVDALERRGERVH